MVSRLEFEAAMVAVDNELKADDVPIPHRPLSAVGLVCARLGIHDQPVPVFSSVVHPEDFSAVSIGGQVHAWYKRRYGDRLNLRLGMTVLQEVNCDIWELKIPLIYGRAHLIVDPASMGSPRRPVAKYDAVTHNVLDSVVGLTPDLARSISRDDAKSLLEGFVLALGVFNSLSTGMGSPLLRPAFSDLAASVRAFLDARDYGHAMWSSLQFAEKVMKARMELDGVRYPKSHKLIDLVPGLAKHGRSVDQGDLDQVQCDAAARYGQAGVSRTQAFRAHLAALRVAKRIWCP